MSGEKLAQLGGGIAAEVEEICGPVCHSDTFVTGGPLKVDPQKWSPLIYNFRHYFRLAGKSWLKTFRFAKNDKDSCTPSPARFHSDLQAARDDQDVKQKAISAARSEMKTP